MSKKISQPKKILIEESKTRQDYTDKVKKMIYIYIISQLQIIFNHLFNL